MARRAVDRPTDGELEILRVLWARGPSTVRQVYDELSARKETGYTTVLKLMQIMTGKGTLVRDEDSSAHVYRAAVGEEQTQRHLVKDLLERAFGGSAEKLIVAALGKKASKEEMQQIRRMIAEHGRQKEKGKS